jgi:CRISPR-associated endonuclease/helicase Cas3
VYPHTLVLWRTAQILARKQGWKMPDDARELLEYVYDEDGKIPTGLADATIAMEGERISQRDAGAFATLRLESGYSDTGRWDEEARVATRLGQDSHTLYLASWENGSLTPWINEGRYRWDLSSLRVNKQQLQQLAPISDAVLQQALDQLRERENLFDEYSFIVPLSCKDKQWQCAGLNEQQRQVQITYDRKSGLEIVYD